MKIVGTVILVAASYFCGVTVASWEGEKIKALDSMVELLGYLFRRMETECIPLKAIFNSYKNDYLEKTGFLPALRNGSNSLSALWGNGLEKLCLESESKDELLHLGESLGRLDLESQLKRIESCRMFLEQKMDSLRISIPKKQKSIKAIAFLLGAMGAIILI